ncbi:hypothetical protein OSTOST_16831, partial [Ostertagia ostertagi]
DDDSAPIDVGGTSPLSGNLPPPPAPPAILEGRPSTFLGSTTPQQPILPISQLTSNGNTVSQFLNTSIPPSFQTQPTYGVSQSQPSSFVPQTNTAVAPPATGQPPNFALGQNLSVPPPIATQPPPNIQALLKSIPSLQTIQQATAAAAAAAAAAANNQRPQQNLPSMNYPPPVTQQRFGDVDERVQPIQTIQTPVQPIQQVQPMHPVQPVAAQPPPASAPNFHLPPPRSQQSIYAEEGPSHIEYPPAVPGGDHEHHNGDNNYYGEGGRDGFYQKPPPAQFHNSGNYPPHGRGRPRGGGFYGHGGGRGDQWRKSNVGEGISRDEPKIGSEDSVPMRGDYRGGRGFVGPRGNLHNRGRGFQGGGFPKGRGRGNWGRDDY